MEIFYALVIFGIVLRLSHLADRRKSEIDYWQNRCWKAEAQLEYLMPKRKIDKRV